MIVKTALSYLRFLASHPTFTAGVVLSLALGIGANTAVFSCVNALLLRPLPVAEPERLVTVYATSTDAPGDFWGLSHPNFLDYRAGNDAFSSMVVFRPVVLRLTGGDSAELVNGEMVSGNYFETLGLRPALGRTFRPEEDRTPGTHPVAVVSHRMWQERFGADRGVIGRVMVLNGQPFTIIGVAPRGFRGLVTLGSPEVWVPTMMHERVLFGRIASWFNERDALILNTVGRLKPGVSLRQAEVALQTMAANLERTYPVANKGLGIALVPLTQATIHYSLRGTIVLASKILMVLVGMLLLVTAANVANLLLARALERRREVAVRLSIGANRGQLAQQLIVEGLILSFAGGAVGLLVARWVRDLLWALRPSFVPATLDVGLDMRVLGFTLALCVATGLFFGLAPLLQVFRFELVTALKNMPTMPRKSGARKALLVTQMALAFVSLAIAGLFLQSLRSSQETDPGFEVEKIALVSFDLGPHGYTESAGRAFGRQLIERVSTLPGVRSATLAERIMYDFRGPIRVGILIQGREPPPTDEGSMIRINHVGTRYFETLGIGLQRGRGFAEQDREGTPHVAVINAAMERRFWPGGSALDKYFHIEGETDPIQIVGIAEDCDFVAPGQKDEPLIYLPLLQRYSPAVTLHVLTAGDPAAILPTLRREIHSLDRNLALTSERTAPQILAESLWVSRTSALLLSFFSLIALLLAAAGVYSTTAFSVRSRFREFGIRRVLGAQRADLLRIVLVEGGSLIGSGLLIGTFLAALALPHVSSLLSGVEGLTSLIFAGAGMVVVIVALAANLFATREVMNVEVTRALYQE